MAKDKALSWYKEKAWNAFSAYIRTRDCLLATGDPEEGSCVTCKRPYPYKQLQAGHWLPGRRNAVLFSEQGVHAQCFGCNGRPPRGKGGNPIEYWLFMEEVYGREIMDRLLLESKQTVVYKKPDFEGIREKYIQKTEALLSGKLVAQLDTPLDRELPF